MSRKINPGATQRRNSDAACGDALRAGRDDLEAALAEAQKMAALGRLAGGVAHDFNNLLAVVIGSAEALSGALEDRPELLGLAQVALDAAERGAELVARLLAVARSQPPGFRPVDCVRFLQDMLPILARTVGCNVDVVVHAPGAPVWCLADPTQLTSAVLNLAVNARDAMPDGGRIVLRVERRPCETGQPAFAMISLEDTGEGMDACTRARALEPFFTTKPEGRGSGLGLSMVHGFVCQSGGRMEIDSEPGRGACVRLILPVTDLGEAVADRAPEPCPIGHPAAAAA